MNKISVFQKQPVTFIESIEVAKGVKADTYRFDEDNLRDLAIVQVTAKHQTPLQKILKGDKTIEGYLSGKGSLKIQHIDTHQSIYEFPNNEKNNEIIVDINEIMQWSAQSDLVFYEICYPPYEDGRYENLISS